MCLGWLVNIDSILRQFRQVFDLRWPWPLTYYTKHWHTGYSWPEERLHRFWFFATFSFQHRSPVKEQTNGRARLVMRPIGMTGQWSRALLQRVDQCWYTTEYTGTQSFA